MNNSILNTDGNSQSYGLLEPSAKVEYAMLALLELAINHGVTLTINDIAAKQPIPERYLEQILTQLRRAGIVQSQRGSKGGFLLVREPWEISLLEIVSLVEGERNEKRNANVLTIEKTLVWEIWERANIASVEVLGRYTLQDLCQEREIRSQNNPMYYI
ncbi:Rrf2 family transcriptional regulator [Cylindrospermopsis raciborskii LB2897]|nr:Rrf2 family transcriptional regulator [Cylindrospermopsis raciborskii LB2897]